MSARSRLALAWRALTTYSEAGWTMARGSTPDEHQRNGREVRRLGWERNPVVNACVRAITDIVAAVDFEVYRKLADGTCEVIPNHDAALMLNLQPRVGMTGLTLRAQTSVHYLLYGNSEWEIERSGKRPMGVRVIHPELLHQVEINTDDQIEWYNWRDTAGRNHRSRAEDILHFKDLTASEDGLFGYPRAAAALQDIAADYEATQYVRQVVTNHGVPGLAVKTKGFKNQADLTAAEERFNEKMKTRGGRGSAYFINAEEVEFEQIGFTLSELEFPDLRAIAREDICAVFHVDPRMVGFASASGKEGGMSGVQFREARFKLIQQSVMPVMKGIEAELNRWFMPEWGDVYIRFSPDALSELTEDETQTSTRIVAEFAAKIRTFEEARETIGLTAEVDPTHHLASGEGLQSVKVAMEEGEKTPAEKEKEMADANPRPEPMARVTPAQSLTRAMSLTDEQRMAAWQEFDTRATREESILLRVLRVLFEYEQSRLLPLFAGLDAVASDEVNAPLLRQIGELYAPGGEIYERWVKDTQSAFLKMVDFDLPNPRAIAAIRDRANKLAGNVTETTFEEIRGFLIVGREQGLHVRDVASMIESASFSPERSQTIARTETIGALNQAAYQQAIQQNVMRSKSWLSQRDGLVRDTHSDAESQGWIPVEQAFGNGLQFPGDQIGPAEEVINCRCTLLYSDEEPK